MTQDRPRLFRRPYVQLWLAGFVFWMAALQWLRLPHWATSFGWVALAFYLGFYLPVFVAISRIAVHRLSIPLMIAAPVVWTGLELARAHLLTGFLIGAVGHTQYRWIELIQISDLTGGYGVDFVILFVAAALSSLVPDQAGRWRLWPIISATALLGAVLAYGYWRTAGDYHRPGPKVALIQGSIDSTLKSAPESAGTVFSHYYELSADAVREHDDIDLVVWPETMFRYSLVTFDDDLALPEGVGRGREAFKDDLRAWNEQSMDLLRLLAQQLDTSLLVGVDQQHFGREGQTRYNSSVFTDSRGNLLGQYHKMHRVMFGEYVPLAYYFPFLYRLTPLPGGIDAGEAPECVEVAGARFAPNICYESVIPHTIRSQVSRLRDDGEEPHVLVNLTNDGWFWGSSALDMHMACGIFRAVEMRKPFLIAANTGFSAWVDSDGRLRERGPRRDTGIIVADVELDQRRSLYLLWGDWFAGLCLLATLGFALVGYASSKTKS